MIVILILLSQIDGVVSIKITIKITIKIKIKIKIKIMIESGIPGKACSYTPPSLSGIKKMRYGERVAF